MTPQEFFAFFPTGTILLFAGDPANTPTGWHVCDGQNGTVNLVDRIPVGLAAGAALASIGQQQGDWSHTHHFSQNTGTFGGANNNNIVQDGHSALDCPGTDHIHNVNGDTAGPSNRPPITSLFFIQKT